MSGRHIPRALTSRDPGRDADIVAAIDALVAISAFVPIMTRSAVADLAKAGISRPSGITVVDAPPDNMGQAIGWPYRLERGLILPDNVILHCEGCEIAVQYRPEMAHAKVRHLCPFCAADAALKDYWESQQ